MFVNFREVQPESRGKMQMHYPEAYQRLLDAETDIIGCIWIKISDWRGCLDHLAPEKPTGRGQIFRRSEKNERIVRETSGSGIKSCQPLTEA